LNLEGGICCYTKVFFRPDIGLDIEPQVFDGWKVMESRKAKLEAKWR